MDVVIFFGPDQDNIDEAIKELEDDGLYLTDQDDANGLLGVKIKTDKNSGKVTLTQGGLDKKVPKILGTLDSNKKISPSSTAPLIIYADVLPFYEPF